jgi:hypothetical protein
MFLKIRSILDDCPSTSELVWQEKMFLAQEYLADFSPGTNSNRHKIKSRSMEPSLGATP